MKLRERIGKYSSYTKIKVGFIDKKVSIRVNINSNGGIEASFDAGIKSGSKTFNFNPDSEEEYFNLEIGDINIAARFNGNQSISVSLPNAIKGFKILERNITLKKIDIARFCIKNSYLE